MMAVSRKRRNVTEDQGGAPNPLFELELRDRETRFHSPAGRESGSAVSVKGNMFWNLPGAASSRAFYIARTGAEAAHSRRTEGCHPK